MSQAMATSIGTAERLLSAAVEVFAELGYRRRSARFASAGANNAAVNYHFHDKEHLYLAVIEHAIREMRAHVPRADADAASPEERLRSFVRSALTTLLGEGPPSWLMKLMSQELAEPTAGLDLMIEKVITSVDGELASIVRDSWRWAPRHRLNRCKTARPACLRSATTTINGGRFSPKCGSIRSMARRRLTTSPTTSRAFSWRACGRWSISKGQRAAMGPRVDCWKRRRTT